MNLKISNFFLFFFLKYNLITIQKKKNFKLQNIHISILYYPITKNYFQMKFYNGKVMKRRNNNNKLCTIYTQTFIKYRISGFNRISQFF